MKIPAGTLRFRRVDERLIQRLPQVTINEEITLHECHRYGKCRFTLNKNFKCFVGSMVVMSAVPAWILTVF